jgi:hypothetical protein
MEDQGQIYVFSADGEKNVTVVEFIIDARLDYHFFFFLFFFFFSFFFKKFNF